jgi:hypothetical protein
LVLSKGVEPLAGGVSLDKSTLITCVLQSLLIAEKGK